MLYHVVTVGNETQKISCKERPMLRSLLTACVEAHELDPSHIERLSSLLLSLMDATHLFRAPFIGFRLAHSLPIKNK